MRDFLEERQVYRNITLDYRPGNPELVLRLDGEAIQRTGLNPAIIGRALQAYVDGELVTDFQDEGEEVKVRVLAKKDRHINTDNLMRQTISLPDGRSIALGELVTSTPGIGRQNIRHYNFRRAITLEADIDKDQIDTLQANNLITEQWRTLQARYPELSLDQTGELDDIDESLDAIWVLLLLGLGIIYIILGTQFRSYFQPFMVLATVPLTFTGVTLGLLVTGNPLSLFTLYGVVALTGISVNAAIVLISAANLRLESGMSLLHATVYAARTAGRPCRHHLGDHGGGLALAGHRPRRRVADLGARGNRYCVWTGVFHAADAVRHPVVVPDVHGLQFQGCGPGPPGTDLSPSPSGSWLTVRGVRSIMRVIR